MAFKILTIKKIFFHFPVFKIILKKREKFKINVTKHLILWCKILCYEKNCITALFYILFTYKQKYC